MRLRILLLLTLFASVVPVLSMGRAYGKPWGYFTDPFPDRSTWRGYYLDHAQPRLGTERRLRNGISWRLHTDKVSGVAWPRITWMPQVGLARTANELFDVAHGGAMLTAAGIEEEYYSYQEIRQKLGYERPLPKPPIKQIDIDLTYASVNLASVVDLELGLSEGRDGTQFLRGITFDLARKEIYYLTACDGDQTHYGRYPESGPNFLFRFGPILKVCDHSSYDAFKSIYAIRAERAAKLALHDPDFYVRECIGFYLGKDKDVEQDQEILLYLTFDGLAVHRLSFGDNAPAYNCPLRRSAINPTIIPYRDLAHLMQPGPWRDELLALK